MSEPQANDHFSEKAQPKTLCYLIFKAEQLPLDRYQQMLNSKWVSKAEYKRLQDNLKTQSAILVQCATRARELEGRISELQETLLAIKQHYEKRPDFCLYLPDGSRNWYQIGVLCRTWLEELGVLLNGKVEAKNK